MKQNNALKKLTLNKETVSNLDILSRDAQRAIAAGYKACWENLWTAYYCTVIWTGNDQTTGVAPADTLGN